MRDDSLQQNKMGVMPVGRLLANMAIPMIISMLVQALYNIVDSIYVSQVSESAVTALSLAFPIQNLQIGFALGIGVGVNSLLSKSLGEGNRRNANRAAGNGAVMVMITTGLFVIFGLFGVRPYYEFQSEVAETVEGGIIYSQICCVMTMGVFLQVWAERLLQATGRTVLTMITQATGAIINIILDPIFIHGRYGLPAMGIAGAAVATVIGQWVGAGMGLYLNLRYNPDVHLSFKYLKLEKEISGPILAVGIPSMLMNSVGSVMNFGMNQILQGFHETATGVFGIYYKLQSFFFMPVFGINGAAISVIAFNYGARKPKRIVQTLKCACGACLAFMVAGFVAFQLAPELLLGMFNPSPAFLEIGCNALRIISIHFPVAAFCISSGAFFQALGNGIYSTITSVFRQLLALLPAAYLLSLTGNVSNVWWAFPIAEVISAIVTLYFFLRIYRQKVKPMFENS